MLPKAQVNKIKKKKNKEVVQYGGSLWVSLAQFAQPLLSKATPAVVNNYWKRVVIIYLFLAEL